MLGRVMASNRAFRLAFIPLVLLAFILIFSAACKGGASGANVTESLSAEIGNHPSQDAGGIAEEIAGLEAPTDVDPGLFDALKKAFAAKVKECERFTSSAPPGDFVTDLEYDPETGTLLWSYVNAGDCDLSGDVAKHLRVRSIISGRGSTAIIRVKSGLATSRRSRRTISQRLRSTLSSRPTIRRRAGWKLR